MNNRNNHNSSSPPQGNKKARFQTQAERDAVSRVAVWRTERFVQHLSVHGSSREIASELSGGHVFSTYRYGEYREALTNRCLPGLASKSDKSMEKKSKGDDDADTSEEEAEERLIMQDAIEATRHLDKSAEPSLLEIMLTEPNQAYALRYSSLYILPEHTAIRILLYNFVKTKLFENFILLVILFNSAILAVQPQVEAGVGADGFGNMDTFITVIFSIELVLKILALGFVLHKGAYLRDGWNCLDGFIMLTTYISLLGSGTGNLSALRTFRVIRPLRSMNAVKGLKILVRSLSGSVMKLSPVLVMLFLALFVFSILSVQLFGGAFRVWCVNNVTGAIGDPCNMGSATVGYWGASCADPAEVCTDVGNVVYGDYNFDNVLTGMLVLFTITTFDGWTTILTTTYASVGVISFLFFVIVTLIIGFVIPNLVLAVINLEYARAQENDREYDIIHSARVRRLTQQRTNQFLLTEHAIAMRIKHREDRDEEIAMMTMMAMNNNNNTNNDNNNNNNNANLDSSDVFFHSPPRITNNNNNNNNGNSIRLQRRVNHDDNDDDHFASQNKRSTRNNNRTTITSPSLAASQQKRDNDEKFPQLWDIDFIETMNFEDEVEDPTLPIIIKPSHEKPPEMAPAWIMFDEAQEATESGPSLKDLRSYTNTDTVLSQQEQINRKNRFQQHQHNNKEAMTNQKKTQQQQQVQTNNNNNNQHHRGASGSSDPTILGGRRSSSVSAANNNNNNNSIGRPRSNTTTSQNFFHTGEFPHNNNNNNVAIISIPNQNHQQDHIQQQQQHTTNSSKKPKRVRSHQLDENSFEYKWKITRKKFNQIRDWCHEFTEGYERSVAGRLALVSGSDSDFSEVSSNDTDLKQFAASSKDNETSSSVQNQAAAEAGVEQSQSYFSQFIILCIILNTVVLATQYFGQPDWLNYVQDNANLCFTSIFACEMVLRLMSLGISKYLRSSFNILDGTIVISSLVELGLSGGSILSVFRALRLLRVLKLLKQFPTIRALVRVAFAAMTDTLYLLLIILLYLFIFALLGNALFGDTVPPTEKNRTTFTTFLDSFYTAFQLLSQDMWVTLMYQTMDLTNPAACLFFIIQIFFGSFVLLAMFLAILVETFNRMDQRRIMELAEADDAAGVNSNMFKQNMLDSHVVRRIYSNNNNSNTTTEEKDEATVGVNNEKFMKFLPEQLRRDLLRAQQYETELEEKMLSDYKRRQSRLGSMRLQAHSIGMSDGTGNMASPTIDDITSPFKVEADSPLSNQNNNNGNTNNSTSSPTNINPLSPSAFHQKQNNNNNNNHRNGNDDNDDDNNKNKTNSKNSKSKNSKKLKKESEMLDPDYEPSLISRFRSCFGTNTDANGELEDEDADDDDPSISQEGKKGVNEKIPRLANPNLTVSNMRAQFSNGETSASASAAAGERRLLMEYIEAIHDNPQNRPPKPKNSSNKSQSSSINNNNNNMNNANKAKENALYGELGAPSPVPESMLPREFKDFRLRRKQSQNIFFAPAPRRIKDIVPAIIMFHEGPAKEDVAPKEHNVTCARCGDVYAQPLPAAPLMAPPDPELFHGLQCYRIRLRKAKEKILNAMKNIVGFYIANDEEQSPEKVEAILSCAWSLKCMLSVSTEEILEKDSPWHTLETEIQEELDVLALRTGEEELGKSLVAYAFACSPVDHSTNGGISLFLFGAKNEFRLACSKLVWNPAFEYFILFSIILSSVLLAMQNPLDDQKDERVEIVYWLSLAFTIIFTFEAACKMVAFGLVIHEGAYLRDLWNWLDLIVVVVSLIADSRTILNFRVLRVLKTFRALRPLRILNRNSNLKTTAYAMAENLKAIANVALLMIIALFIFAILAVQLFGGTFRSCTDPSIMNETACNGSWLDPNSEAVVGGVPLDPSFPNSSFTPRVWRSEIRNFDDVGSSLLTLFQISTSEAWSQILWRSFDACSTTQEEANCSQIQGLFFVAFFAIAGFFLTHLFVSFIIHNYEMVQESISGANSMTEEQKVWVQTQQLLVNLRPSIAMIPIEGYKSSAWIFNNLVSKPWFDPALAACILIDIFSIALIHHDMSQEWSDVIQGFNIAIQIIFTFEFIFKFMAFHWRYFKTKSNQFDCSLVLIGFVSLAASDVKRLVVLRVFRFLRILRLLRSAQGISILMETILYSLPSIANMGAFIVLITFCFGVLGVDLMATMYIAPDSQVFDTRYNNFRQLDYGLMMLYRYLTLEDWVGSLTDAQVAWPKCSSDQSCGSSLFALYFCGFIIINSYVILNLVMAIILVNFELTMKLTGANVRLGQFHRFVEIWSEYENEEDNTPLQLKTNMLPRILYRLGPPLGLSRPDSRNQIMRCLKNYFIPEHGGRIHFIEVLLALAQGSKKTDLSARDQREFSERLRSTFPELLQLKVFRHNNRTLTTDLYFAQAFMAAAYRRNNVVEKLVGRLRAERRDEMRSFCERNRVAVPEPRIFMRIPLRLGATRPVTLSTSDGNAIDIPVDSRLGQQLLLHAYTIPVDPSQSLDGNAASTTTAMFNLIMNNFNEESGAGGGASGRKGNQKLNTPTLAPAPDRSKHSQQLPPAALVLDPAANDKQQHIQEEQQQQQQSGTSSASPKSTTSASRRLNAGSKKATTTSSSTGKSTNKKDDEEDTKNKVMNDPVSAPIVVRVQSPDGTEKIHPHHSSDYQSQNNNNNNINDSLPSPSASSPPKRKGKNSKKGDQEPNSNNNNMRPTRLPPLSQEETAATPRSQIASSSQNDEENNNNNNNTANKTQPRKSGITLQKQPEDPRFLGSSITHHPFNGSDENNFSNNSSFGTGIGQNNSNNQHHHHERSHSTSSSIQPIGVSSQTAPNAIHLRSALKPGNSTGNSHSNSRQHSRSNSDGDSSNSNNNINNKTPTTPQRHVGFLGSSSNNADQNQNQDHHHQHQPPQSISFGEMTSPQLIVSPSASSPPQRPGTNNNNNNNTNNNNSTNTNHTNNKNFNRPKSAVPPPKIIHNIRTPSSNRPTTSSSNQQQQQQTSPNNNNNNTNKDYPDNNNTNNNQSGVTTTSNTNTTNNNGANEDEEIVNSGEDEGKSGSTINAPEDGGGRRGLSRGTTKINNSEKEENHQSGGGGEKQKELMNSKKKQHKFDDEESDEEEEEEQEEIEEIEEVEEVEEQNENDNQHTRPDTRHAFDDNNNNKDDDLQEASTRTLPPHPSTQHQLKNESTAQPVDQDKKDSVSVPIHAATTADANNNNNNNNSPESVRRRRTPALSHKIDQPPRSTGTPSIDKTDPHYVAYAEQERHRRLQQQQQTKPDIINIPAAVLQRPLPLEGTTFDAKNDNRRSSTPSFDESTGNIYNLEIETSSRKIGKNDPLLPKVEVTAATPRNREILSENANNNAASSSSSSTLAPSFPILRFRIQSQESDSRSEILQNQQMNFEQFVADEESERNESFVEGPRQIIIRQEEEPRQDIAQEQALDVATLYNEWKKQYVKYEIANNMRLIDLSLDPFFEKEIKNFEYEQEAIRRQAKNQKFLLHQRLDRAAIEKAHQTSLNAADFIENEKLERFAILDTMQRRGDLLRKSEIIVRDAFGSIPDSVVADEKDAWNALSVQEKSEVAQVRRLAIGSALRAVEKEERISIEQLENSKRRPVETILIQERSVLLAGEYEKAFARIDKDCDQKYASVIVHEEDNDRSFIFMAMQKEAKIAIAKVNVRRRMTVENAEEEHRVKIISKDEDENFVNMNDQFVSQGKIIQQQVTAAARQKAMEDLANLFSKQRQELVNQSVGGSDRQLIENHEIKERKSMELARRLGATNLMTREHILGRDTIEATETSTRNYLLLVPEQQAAEELSSAIAALHKATIANIQERLQLLDRQDRKRSSILQQEAEFHVQHASLASSLFERSIADYFSSVRKRTATKLAALQNREEAERVNIITREDLESQEGWKCPVCAENPPYRLSRLANDVNENPNGLGFIKLRIHLRNHKIELAKLKMHREALTTEAVVSRSVVILNAYSNYCLETHATMFNYYLTRAENGIRDLMTSAAVAESFRKIKAETERRIREESFTLHFNQDWDRFFAEEKGLRDLLELAAFHKPMCYRTLDVDEVEPIMFSLGSIAGGVDDEYLFYDDDVGSHKQQRHHQDDEETDNPQNKRSSLLSPSAFVLDPSAQQQDSTSSSSSAVAARNLIKNNNNNNNRSSSRERRTRRNNFQSLLGKTFEKSFAIRRREQKPLPEEPRLLDADEKIFRRRVQLSVVARSNSSDDEDCYEPIDSITKQEEDEEDRRYFIDYTSANAAKAAHVLRALSNNGSPTTKTNFLEVSPSPLKKHQKPGSFFASKASSIMDEMNKKYEKGNNDDDDDDDDEIQEANYEQKRLEFIMARSGDKSTISNKSATQNPLDDDDGDDDYDLDGSPISIFATDRSFEDKLQKQKQEQQRNQITIPTKRTRMLLEKLQQYESTHRIGTVEDNENSRRNRMIESFFKGIISSNSNPAASAEIIQKLLATSQFFKNNYYSTALSPETIKSIENLVRTEAVRRQGICDVELTERVSSLYRSPRASRLGLDVVGAIPRLLVATTKNNNNNQNKQSSSRAAPSSSSASQQQRQKYYQTNPKNSTKTGDDNDEVDDDDHDDEQKEDSTSPHRRFRDVLREEEEREKLHREIEKLKQMKKQQEQKKLDEQDEEEAKQRKRRVHINDEGLDDVENGTDKNSKREKLFGYDPESFSPSPISSRNTSKKKLQFEGFTIDRRFKAILRYEKQVLEMISSLEAKREELKDDALKKADRKCGSVTKLPKMPQLTKK